MLYSTLTFSGGQAIYQGDAPVREREINGNTITEYYFDGWNKTLSNISRPTSFTAMYKQRTFTAYKTVFMDQSGTQVLYSDYVESGHSAKYPYSTPWSYDKENVTMFAGWGKSLSSITKDTVFRMKLKTISRSQNGEYPQSKATDPKTLSGLKGLNTTYLNGYCEYNDSKYKLLNGNYYKVEPIRWRYLSEDGDSALFVSESILDAKRYNSYWQDLNSNGFYANNYKQSELRRWLNNDFLSSAFDDTSLIKTTEIDNSSLSTGDSDNPYICENTYDKVFLLSYNEIADSSNGLDSSGSRISNGTEFAKAQGLVSSSSWWLRSPCDRPYSTSDGYYARSISSNGGFSYEKVDNANNGIRPAIRMSLN